MNTTDSVVDLGRLALAFGRVDRITFHPDGKTRESDTDHTVMLGLIGCALAGQVREDLDVGLVAQFALVHDLVEVYAGDTNTLRTMSAEDKAAKAAREHAAFERIKAEFGDTLPWLHERIAEYEERRTPEARYVKALDKLLPKIIHLLNGLVTFRQQGISYAEAEKRYADQEQEIAAYASDFPALMDLRAELVKRVLAEFPATVEAGRGWPS